MVYSPIPYGYPISAPPATVPPAPVFPLDPSLAPPVGDNEWAELARTNPNAFLSSLLAALAAPNPVSNAGPSVEDAFKSHLVSLAPNPAQAQPIPTLYSILKTFWLPASPAYFSLTASGSTARTLSEHRFLYWDPQPLVFNGIACPSCSTPLINKGRISSGPVKIYDIEKPFFIVGCEYVCRSPACVAAIGSPEGRKYASTDSSILRSLPMLLKEEFPVRLLNGDADSGSGSNIWNWKAMGVSTGLWNLVNGALRAGLKKDVILRIIWSVQHKEPDLATTAAEDSNNGPASSSSSSQQNPAQPHAPPNEMGQRQDDVDAKMETEEEEGDEEQDGEGEGEEADQEMNVAAPPESSSPHAQQPFISNVSLSATYPSFQILIVPQAFSDAYGEAWKENSAIAETSPPKKTPAAAATPILASAPAPTPTPASGSAPAPAATASSATPAPSVPPPASQQTMHPLPQIPVASPTYNPYTAYPFTPYAYMPHHLVNGQIVPLAVGQQLNPGPSALLPTASVMTPNGMVTTGEISVTHSKRNPRHCCKCGSQDCKGKGGRSFCANGCQDCGKLECKGRNSRRPDKKCSEGWT